MKIQLITVILLLTLVSPAMSQDRGGLELWRHIALSTDIP